MRLSGIEIRNYRSIGDSFVTIRPLSKCNIIIGQNNSGKSNVLRSIKLLSDHTLSRSKYRPVEIDRHRREERPPTIRAWFNLDISHQLAIAANTPEFWFQLAWPGGNDFQIDDYSIASIDNFWSAQAILKTIQIQFGRQLHGSLLREELLKYAPHFFEKFRTAIPPAHLIPEFRKVGSGDSFLSGAGLVETIAAFKSPAIGNEGDHEKFNKLQEFFRDLLRLPTATLDVDRGEPASLIIENNGLRLPITSYGTGVHELLILLVAVLQLENSICCIEEPEIHLHPRLQRELVRFLVEKTSNIYFLSTHSPTLINLDREDVSTVYLQIRNEATVSERIASSNEGLRAARDLGLRPSDFLQATVVLWVEGPSDRLYIKRWLELTSPELKEGTDFTFVYYSQLPELLFEEENESDMFIDVLRINRNAILVMDSDKPKEDSALDAKKERLKIACDKMDTYCWVSDGREIENYLTRRTVVSFCKEVRFRNVDYNPVQFDKFSEQLDNALKIANVQTINYSGSKVNFARKIVQHISKEDIEGQLKDHVSEIIKRINAWNT